MPTIYFNDQSYSTDEGESVLDALLRQGVDIPHGCKAGACQSCMMQNLDRESSLPPGAQVGLKDSRKQLGYFLSCSCKPTADLRVALADQSGEKYAARLLEKQTLSDSVVRLRLASDMPFKPGQYLNVWLDDKSVRSYSIASLPSEGFLELHVRLIPGGAFSEQVRHHLQPGDRLAIQGPLGDCIYTGANAEQALLLAGVGTGLAPLYGIVKDALAQGHSGAITLFLGAREDVGFYMLDELTALASRHANFKLYCHALVTQAGSAPIQQGDIYRAVQQTFPSTKGCRVYLCGADTFVRKMKKQCFLAGASMREIHADAFLPCG